jgi:uncharacterized membrane protein
MKLGLKLGSKDVALVSVFAALLVIVSRLPGVPIAGGEGTIEFTVILTPIIGIVLGPWLGGLAAFIGNFIGWIIPKTTFMGFLYLPTGAVAAIVSGALARNSRIANWKLSAILIAVLNGLWYLTPPGQEIQEPLLLIYPFLHWAAFILVILFRERISVLFHSGIREKVTLGTVLCCFSGIMANHMAGNLIFITSVGWFASLKAIKNAVKTFGFWWLKSGLANPDDIGPLGALFAFYLPFTIVERLLFTAFATYVGIGIVFALRRSGVIGT